MHLENMMLSERSRTQNATYCRSSFLQNLQNKQIIERESRLELSEAGWRGNEECLLNGYEMSIWDDEKVLE